MTILDTKDYIIEAKRQLADTNCYKNLPFNPTLNHSNTVNSTIEVFKNQYKIPEKIAEGLKVWEPKTPTLKLPPKVHKEGHLGRPLVSSIDSPTSKSPHTWTSTSNHTPTLSSLTSKTPMIS